MSLASRRMPRHHLKLWFESAFNKTASLVSKFTENQKQMRKLQRMTASVRHKITQSVSDGEDPQELENDSSLRSSREEATLLYPIVWDPGQLETAILQGKTVSCWTQWKHTFHSCPSKALANILITDGHGFIKCSLYTEAA